MKTVFLSASIPDPKRDRQYFETADFLAIGDAVHALCSVVLPQDRLVFGGHPAIIPIVQRVAAMLDRHMSVSLYLSAFFKDQFPAEYLHFKNLVLTEPGDDRAHSIELMRKKMLSIRFDAGVFIGGMEGVIDEWKMLREQQDAAAAWPIPTTGAAARIIFENEALSGDRDRRFDEELRSDRVYAPLFRRLLGLAIPEPPR